MLLPFFFPLSGTFTPSLEAIVVASTRRLAASSRDEAKVADHIKTVSPALDIMDAHLSKHAYLAGSAYSLAASSSSRTSRSSSTRRRGRASSTHDRTSKTGSTESHRDTRGRGPRSTTRSTKKARKVGTRHRIPTADRGFHHSIRKIAVLSS
jgi:hypothetical protein